MTAADEQQASERKRVALKLSHPSPACSSPVLRAACSARRCRAQRQRRTSPRVPCSAAPNPCCNARCPAAPPARKRCWPSRGAEGAAPRCWSCAPRVRIVRPGALNAALVPDSPTLATRARGAEASPRVSSRRLSVLQGCGQVHRCVPAFWISQRARSVSLACADASALCRYCRHLPQSAERGQPRGWAERGCVSAQRSGNAAQRADEQPHAAPQPRTQRGAPPLDAAIRSMRAARALKLLHL